MLILDLGRQDIGGKFLGQIDGIGNLPDHLRGAIAPARFAPIAPLERLLSAP